MLSPQPIPQSLKVVAYLFIVSGVLAVIDIVISLLNGKIDIDFGVLGIFIGRGLLQLNPTSHTWAIVLVRLGMIIGTIISSLFLFNPGELELFGQTIGQAPPGLLFIVSSVLTALIYWQHSILNNPEIKRLFGKTS